VAAVRGDDRWVLHCSLTLLMIAAYAGSLVCRIALRGARARLQPGTRPDVLT
jgi:hypothetical protein